jgi:hypothetical protein
VCDDQKSLKAEDALYYPGNFPCLFHRLPRETKPKKFIYILFIVVYLKVFSVSPATLLQMIGRSVNNDLEMM